jgi:hypothetical protein
MALWAERLAVARHRLFVGREAERRIFRRAVSGAELPYQLLHIHGPGGIGKTALLREFWAYSKRAKMCAIWLDARDIEPNPDAFCAALDAALGFDTSSEIHPCQRASEYMARAQGRIALLIDTAECLAPLDHWLRETLLPSLPQNCFVATAGREPLSAAWQSDGGWQGLVRQISLTNLDKSHACAYLRRRDVPADEFAAVIDFTRGHPLALSLVADLAAQRHMQHHQESKARKSISALPSPTGIHTPQVIRILVERLVSEVPTPAHRDALEFCAVTRLFDESLLQSLLESERHGVNGKNAAKHANGESTNGASSMKVVTTPVAIPANVTQNGHATTEPPDHASEIEQSPAEKARVLFAWLRSLSFMEAGPGGVFPHDLAREVIQADLRWRNPRRYAELRERARAFYIGRLHGAPQVEQQRILFDYMFLQRDNEILRPFLNWEEFGNLIPDVPRREEHPLIVEAVRRQEGEESARLAAYWLQRQGHNVVVLRDNALPHAGTAAAGKAEVTTTSTRNEIVGFVFMLALQEATPEEITADPATALAWQVLREKAPLRRGEGATYFRFWMALDTHQDISLVQSALAVHIVRHFLTTPRLAWSFLSCYDADFWRPVFDFTRVHRMPETDFEVDGHHFGVYGQDWRALRPLEWLDLLACDGMGLNGTVDVSHPSKPVGLEKSEYFAALQTALRDLDRPATLCHSPLLHSRLVEERTEHVGSDAERVGALQEIIREACRTLEKSPRDVKSYRALHHAYLQPSTSQEQAALELDLPFSTFRRHLKQGVEQMMEILWQSERGGVELGRIEPDKVEQALVDSI